MANPFAAAMAVTNLMMKGCELSLASWQTIFYRTLMMSQANGAALTATERKEFSRMGTEKVEAIIKSSQVMAREMMRLNQQLATMAWSQFWSSGMAMVQFAGGRNPSGAFAAQNRLMQTAARSASDASSKITAAMARAGTKGLQPLHVRASSNARRLARKRR